MIKHLTSFTIIFLALNLTACGKQVPNPPEVERCTYSWKFQKWRCKNSKTGVTENRALNDPRMEFAEGTTQDDALEIQTWIDSIIVVAKKRCR